jgi:hypothetical protein
VNGGRVRIRGRVAQFDLASMGYSQVAGWKNTFRVAAYESESEVVDVSGDIMELNLDRYLDPPLSLQSVVCLRMVSGKNDYGKNSAGSIVLRATGRRDGDIQEFTRIGFIFLPRRVWMKKGVKRTIDIV